MDIGYPYRITWREKLSVERHNFETIDEFDGFFSSIGELPTEMTQLSVGKLMIEFQLVELQGIRLEWNNYAAKVRIRDECLDEGFFFAASLPYGPTSLFNGKEAEFGSAIVWCRGEGNEYVLSSGHAGLLIHVQSYLAMQLGWDIKRGGMQPVSKMHVQKLVRICRQATRMMKSHVAYDHNGYLAGEWRNLILEQLEPALEPWLHANEAETCKLEPELKYFQIFKEAEKLMGVASDTEPVLAERLADRLGVSRATLFRAFRRSLGLGPNRYLQILKLHKLSACAILLGSRLKKLQKPWTYRLELSIDTGRLPRRGSFKTSLKMNSECRTSLSLTHRRDKDLDGISLLIEIIRAGS